MSGRDPPVGRSSGYLDDMSTLRCLYDVHFSQACLLLVSSTKNPNFVFGIYKSWMKNIIFCTRHKKLLFKWAIRCGSLTSCFYLIFQLLLRYAIRSLQYNSLLYEGLPGCAACKWSDSKWPWEQRLLKSLQTFSMYHKKKQSRNKLTRCSRYALMTLLVFPLEQSSCEL